MRITDAEAAQSQQGVPLLVISYEDEELGRGQYILPEYTFEARAGEYELDDFEEVLEMVLLELFCELPESGNPYSNDVGTARGAKRTNIAQAKKSRQVTFASKAVEKKLRDLISFRPENVEAFKSHTKLVRLRQVKAKKEADKRPRGALEALHAAKRRNEQDKAYRRG